jgi:hypothetical protein
VNWKTGLQLSDVPLHQRIEIACRRCGQVHFRTAGEIATTPERGRLYLDEVEKRLRCRGKACRGEVRIALVRLDDTSAFVGGIA